MSLKKQLRILNMVHHKELCVSEMEKILGMTQSNVSRHLIKLKDTELIESEKQGQFVFHKVNPDAIEQFLFIHSLLTQELHTFKKCKEDWRNSMRSLSKTKCANGKRVVKIINF